MEHDETSKLADVQTKPADLLVGDLADEPAEPVAVVKTTEPAEPAAVIKTTEPVEPRTKTATKNPKRVEQGKRLAEWNKANKRRQLLETTRPALKQLEDAPTRPALKQLKAPTSSFETKGDTKDYFLIGETILIIGLLSVGLFCYTTRLTSTDKAATSGQLEASKKAQLESTQLEAEAEAGGSKKAQLVETQLKEDNIFDMQFFIFKKIFYIIIRWIQVVS